MSHFPVILQVVILSSVSFAISSCSLNAPSADSKSAESSENAPVPDLTQASPPPISEVKGRDPLMEQGAAFMALVNDRKQRLEEDPNDREALLFLGNANYDIVRYDTAKGYYQRYLELDPDHIGARTDLATTYYKTDDLDSAVQELRTVLERAPDHEAALFNLGLILVKDMQDQEGAIEAWEQLLEKHPAHPKADEIRQEIKEMKKS